jgi:hypothetical protein
MKLKKNNKLKITLENEEIDMMYRFFGNISGNDAINIFFKNEKTWSDDESEKVRVFFTSIYHKIKEEMEPK